MFQFDEWLSMARRFLCWDGYLPGFLYRMVSRCLPIVSVEGVIVRDGRVLLLRRSDLRGCVFVFMCF